MTHLWRKDLRVSTDQQDRAGRDPIAWQRGRRRDGRQRGKAVGAMVRRFNRIARRVECDNARGTLGANDHLGQSGGLHARGGKGDRCHRQKQGQKDRGQGAHGVLLAALPRAAKRQHVAAHKSAKTPPFTRRGIA